jgi:hypothetical protein
MIDIERKERISRFLKDVRMSEAVKEVLRSSFLKTKGQRDVQVLAAERIALDLLEEAWKDLQKYQDNESESKPTPITHV